ncbi:F-box domain-containing protein [Madurella fahalii]|uniref:F-box domain-containing protein n=1 Tax=Madurella fahalii TaxID=1157608 RepID=A0ABQ0GA74_9PEZI
MAGINPQLDSRLVQVPLEVLIRITYFISTIELGNVRLTCKALERNLFNFFSHEFFRKKQFMVSSESLQALIDISKHPTLSASLKHVIICTDRLHGTFNVTMDEEQRRRARLAQADHFSLLATGIVRDMLAEAFGNLTSLETVDIRDFNSPSRNRDGYGIPWRSYGAVTLTKTTLSVVTSQPFADPDDYATQLFSTVTAALAVSQSRPKSIEILLKNWRWGLQDYAFFIPPRIEALMVPLLSELQSLHLSLWPPKQFFMIQKFLSLTPNLVWLRLNFSDRLRYDQDDAANHLLTWLGLRETEATADPLDSGPVQLHRLERLDLGSANIWPQALLRLITKFAPTLRSVHLRRMILRDSNDPGMKINPWKVFLSKLAKVPGVGLRELVFSLLKHCTSTNFVGRVSFKNPETGNEDHTWTCSTHSLTLEKAIEETLARMTAEWPHQDPMSVDNSGEEDEEEDEDEDEAEEENDDEDDDGNDEE